MKRKLPERARTIAILVLFLFCMAFFNDVPRVENTVRELCKHNFMQKSMGHGPTITVLIIIIITLIMIMIKSRKKNICCSLDSMHFFCLHGSAQFKSSKSSFAYRSWKHFVDALMIAFVPCSSMCPWRCIILHTQFHRFNDLSAACNVTHGSKSYIIRKTSVASSSILCLCTRFVCRF